MSTYIFGYGSLINTASASRALGRQIYAKDIFTAELHSYRRAWSLMEEVYSAHLERQITAVFLGVHVEIGSYLNGILIALRPGEIERLRLREKNYDQVDVSSHIRSQRIDSEMDSVFTFVSAEKNRAPRHKTTDIFVLKEYVGVVSSGCKALGEEFLRGFEMTTDQPSFEMIEGKYTFIDREQAEYV